MLVNIVYFLYLCFVTLPIYSMVVHMGKELREGALPAELRERLRRARSVHEQVPVQAPTQLTMPIGLGNWSGFHSSASACCKHASRPACSAMFLSDTVAHRPPLPRCLEELWTGVVAVAPAQCLCQ